MSEVEPGPRIYLTMQAAKNVGSGVEDLSLRVISLDYEESESKVDKCEITLDNSDLSYLDHPIFEKGTRLNVSWGYDGRMSPVRAVVVQKCTGFLNLKVEAQGAGVLMQKVARTRTYENTTRSELVHALAKENGFGDNARFIEETSRVIPVQSQAGMTDYAFLKRLAQLEGFEFFIDFDGLHWHPRRMGQRPVKVYQYYLPPLVGDVLSVNIDSDVTAKAGASKKKGKNPLTKETVTAVGSDETTKRPTLGHVPELQGKAPPDGKDNAKKTDAAPLPAEALVINPRTGEEQTIFKPAGATSGDVKNVTDVHDAKTQADAHFTKTQQSVVQITYGLMGDPDQVAKTVIEVRGIGTRLSGKYYITDLKHKVSASGYTMDAKTKTDGGNKGKPAGNSKAETNKKDAPPGGSTTSELTEVLVVDKRTGEEQTLFKDTRGRQN